MNIESELIKIIENILNITGYELKKETRLLGHIPEFDSQAVLAVITAIEEHFGVFFDDEDISAEIFESIETLSQFVETKL